MKRQAITAVSAIAAFTVIALSAPGDGVRLRAAARVAAAAPVKLADVADLEGAEALRFADLSLRERPFAAHELDSESAITLDEVRAALDGAGVNWGRLALTGGRCALRLRGARQPEPAAAIGPPAAPAQASEASAAALAGEETVRARVTALLARVLAASPENLRVRFDPRDDDLLNLSLNGRRVEVQPGAIRSAGERVPFTIWVYAGNRVAERRTILVEAQMRVAVLVLTAEAARKASIRRSMVRVEERWLPPGGSPLVASMEALDGAIARTRLPVGTALRQAHLDSPIVVRKNERVMVHCVGQAIVLKAPARALADGAEGDVIAFKLDGAEHTFLARVDGPGRAVVVLGGSTADETQDAGATP